MDGYSSPGASYVKADLYVEDGSYVEDGGYVKDGSYVDGWDGSYVKDGHAGGSMDINKL